MRDYEVSIRLTLALLVQVLTCYCAESNHRPSDYIGGRLQVSP